MTRVRKAAWPAAALAVLTAGCPTFAGSALAAEGTTGAPATPTTPATVAAPHAAGPAFLGPPVRTPPPPGAIPEQEAVAKVRALFGGLKELPYVRAVFAPGNPALGISYYGTAKPAWDLTFSAADLSAQRDPSSGPADTLHAWVDAFTGAVLGFSRTNPAWTSDRQPDVNMAFQVASEFLKKVESPFQDQAFTQTNFGGISQAASNGADPGQKLLQWQFAEVSFAEKVHGILFPQNSVKIRVDPYGHVVGMLIFRPFDSSKLPDPSGARSRDQAQQALADQLELQKQYLVSPFRVDSTGHPQPTHQPILGYFPANLPAIDALTGKPTSVMPGIQWGTRVDRILTVVGRGEPLQAADQQSAERLLTHVLHMDLSGMTFRQRTLPSDAAFGTGYRIFTWAKLPPQPSASSGGLNRATPEPPGPSTLGEVNAVLDPTGRLVNLNTDLGALRGKPTRLTVQEGEAQAVAFLQQVLPKGTQTLQLVRVVDQSVPPSPPEWFDPVKGADSLPQPMPVYLYSFLPLYQGVPIADHGYMVIVDGTTGRVVGFSVPPAPAVQLPDNRNTITAEQAKAAFLNNQPIRLVYRWPEFGNQAAPQGQLVYEFDTGRLVHYIDAFTGEAKFFPRP
ncbi:MAG: PepSY domain-containing protein [Kyrpidia tusciae]|nr:PepSY domain-containing protein [Kyrpidia tusciae]MBE3552931.1 PepSY domain-containing protein [Kyrpidia tusciae]